jgi:hypothetical protein
MLKAPKHLRIRAYIRSRSVKDRLAHRARAIVLLSIIAGLIVVIAVAAALRHFPA